MSPPIRDLRIRRLQPISSVMPAVPDCHWFVVGLMLLLLLRLLLQRPPPMTVPTTAAVLAQIVAAELRRIHSVGTIHRAMNRDWAESRDSREPD